MTWSDPNYTRKYMREYMIRRYHSRRDEALESLGGKCVECGTTDNLEFDHIDPSTKNFYVGNLWSVSKERFDAEIAKCQILCSKCHIAKSKRNGDYKQPTHGKVNTYSRHKCRCDACVTAHSEYLRSRRTREQPNRQRMGR